MASCLSPEPRPRFPRFPRPTLSLFARPTCVVLLVHRGSSPPSTPPRTVDVSRWPLASYWTFSSLSLRPLPRSSCLRVSLGSRLASPMLVPAGPSTRHFALVRSPWVCPAPWFAQWRSAPSPGCSSPCDWRHYFSFSSGPRRPLLSPFVVTPFTRPALISAGFSFVCEPSGPPSALLPLFPPFPSRPPTALVARRAASALPSPCFYGLYLINAISTRLMTRSRMSSAHASKCACLHAMRTCRCSTIRRNSL